MTILFLKLLLGDVLPYICNIRLVWAGCLQSDSIGHNFHNVTFFCSFEEAVASSGYCGYIDQYVETWTEHDLWWPCFSMIMLLHILQMTQ